LKWLVRAQQLRPIKQVHSDAGVQVRQRGLSCLCRQRVPVFQTSSILHGLG